MHLHKRKTGGWRVIVQHKGQRRSATAPTRAAAQSAGAELLIEMGATPQRTHGNTIRDLLTEHLRIAKMTEGKRYDYLLIITKLETTAPWILDTALDNVDTFTVDSWYARLEQREGWSAHRIRTFHSLLRSASKKGVVWRWLTTNPCVDATKPAEPKSKIKPPDRAMTRRLLALCDAESDNFATYIRLAAASGARRGELCGLKWGDLNPTTGRLTIQRSIDYVPKIGLVIAEQNTGNKNHLRVIKLDPDTLRFLADHHARAHELADQRGYTIGPDNWIFTHDNINPWNPDNVNHTWTTIRNQIPGANNIRPHDLRHAVATQLIGAGVDPRTVAGRLGHSNPATTMRIYAAFIEERDDNASDIMGNLLYGDT